MYRLRSASSDWSLPTALPVSRVLQIRGRAPPLIAFLALPMSDRGASVWPKKEL